ncbi:MAG: GYD domain-containing protein [Spirochaetota bacterium]
MATFLMLGKYSPDAVKGISADRTKKSNNIIKKFEGEFVSMYALLGEYDLAFIVNFPGVEAAMKASVALAKLTGISFTTYPAVTVEEFDRMITK